jgi:hypothetical protein
MPPGFLRTFPPSDEHDGLIVRDFETAPTSWVGAGKQVVDPHHIVTRLGKLGAVGITGPGRDRLLLRPLQPTDLELGRLAAPRTGIDDPLYLGGLCVKVSFIHSFSVIPGR